MRRRLPSTKHIVVLGVALGLAVGVAGGGQEQRAKRATVVKASPTPPPSSGRQLSRREAYTMAMAEGGPWTLCNLSATTLTEPKVLDQVTSLARLAREKPDDLGSAWGETPITPRHALREVVRTAEDDGCAPSVARYAREVLESLPPGP